MPFVVQQKFANVYVSVPYSVVVAYEKDGKINHNIKFSCSSLPEGLFFNEDTGEIYGMITEWVKSQTLVIQVEKEFLRVQLNVLVSATPPQIMFKTVKLPTISFKKKYATKIMVDGGNGAIQYQATGLPKGMACHPTAGVIYGEPIAFGGNSFLNVVVTDSLRNTMTHHYWLKMENEDVERY
ncbi:hypothetical protein QMA56_05875 [Leuconostoc falkenbergense]|uniref:hypothetical protein n=1 Tax=Leuconostoc falkenbergense TaxID=2766470 RepID=UPI0024AD2943|nr:hypothetical protein [Leuconostoc falkenbergense]MDI6667238.1 hypothetical protein [Leuconostoc falkenbergense]